MKIKLKLKRKLKVKRFTQMQIVLALVICALMSVRIPILMYITQGLFLLFGFFYTRAHDMTKKQTVYLFFSIAFLIFCTASGVWAPSMHKYLASLKSIYQIFLVSIFLFICIDSKERFAYVSQVFSAAGWVILIYIAVATPIASWKDMLYGNYSLNSDMGRLGPTIGMHTNMCGYVLSIFIMFAIYQCFILKRKPYALQLFLLFVCLMFTKSRTALVITMVGIFLYIVLCQRMNFRQILRILCGIVFLTIMSYISLYNEFLYSLYGKRLESLLFYFNSSGAADASVYGRVRLQQKAVEVFLLHPVIGVGIGNFSYYNNLNSSVAGLYAHNNFLELLTDVGLVGFALYYVPFLICIVRMYHEMQVMKNQERALYAVYFVLLLIRLIADFAQVSYLYDSSQIMLAVSFSSMKYLKNNKVRVSSG